MKIKTGIKVSSKRYLYTAALLITGVVAGVSGTLIAQQRIVIKKQQQYSFLADRILLGSDKDRTVNFTELRTRLAEYVEPALKDTDYSVYFEYLPTGTSIGFNENKTLIGASLLKVPFAMQYYHALETGEIQGSDVITLKKEHLDSTYGQLYKKGEGYKLTIDELVRIMLTDSDNTALKALADTLDVKLSLDTIDKIFNFVDLNYSSNKEGSTLIGAEAYSSILKCLYFACYVSKDNSQQILNNLTQTSFDNRLKRYIPDEEMPVIAHKIGSFESTTQSDCGIFYQPQKPYLLCVMINGDDAFVSERIGRISIIVHEYITNNVE